MKCQVCGKGEATVLFTHVADSEKKNLYLCTECAAKQKAGPSDKPGKAGKAAPAPVAAPLAPRSAKAAADARPAHPNEPDPAAMPTCPRCRSTYEDFRKRGRLGCSSCYDTFSEEFERLLKRIHGAGQHCGKGPVANLPPSQPEAPAQVEKLQAALEQAVACEDYELAARLRDRIRQLGTPAVGGRGEAGSRPR